MATAKTIKSKTVTTASAWKAATSQDVELPSGHVVRARRVGMEVLVAEGLVPNALMPIVNKALKDGKSPTEAEIKKLSDSMDEEKLKEALSMYDAVLMFVVLEPRVTPIPEDPADRDSSLIYPDEVTMEDKIYMYQWAVGGSSSLEKFRSEQKAAVESIQSSKRVANKTKPAARNRK